MRRASSSRRAAAFLLFATAFAAIAVISGSRPALAGCPFLELQGIDEHGASHVSDRGAPIEDGGAGATFLDKAPDRPRRFCRALKFVSLKKGRGKHPVPFWLPFSINTPLSLPLSRFLSLSLASSLFLFRSLLTPPRKKKPHSQSSLKQQQPPPPRRGPPAPPPPRRRCRRRSCLRRGKKIAFRASTPDPAGPCRLRRP